MKPKKSTLLKLNFLVTTILIILYYYIVHYEKLVPSWIVAFLALFLIVTVSLGTVFWIKRNIDN